MEGLELQGYHSLKMKAKLMLFLLDREVVDIWPVVNLVGRKKKSQIVLHTTKAGF